MTNKQIIFTKINTAELCDAEYLKPTSNQVVVKTAFSAISAGTEKANITGDPNVNGNSNNTVSFPRMCGYSSTGTVIEAGSDVKNLKPGDKVVVIFGYHKKYNTISEKNVIKIPDDSINMQEAAFSFISSFPLAAVRKTKVELGESALCMGLGLLGQFAVKFLKAAGAYPIIAADPVKERRDEALTNGADYALDPLSEGFAEKVHAISGGINAAIEVTGIGAGLDITLDCMAPLGRVALLGCTRDKNFTIDYYKKVHFPGISLIGAHTLARPREESYPGYFTHRDDILSAIRLAKGKRISFRNMIKEIHKPEECFEVYKRLINEKTFPCGVLFDWSDIDD